MTLRLEPPVAQVTPEPPVARGRLLTAEQVAAELLQGSVSPSWVRRHMPHSVRLGHSTVRWWSDDVLAELERRRTG